MNLNLETLLGTDVCSLLRAIGSAADRSSLPAYLVGGVIRDMLLGRAGEQADIDIMIQGNCSEFLQQLRLEWKSRMVGFVAPQKQIDFAKFLTAKLIFDEEIVDGITELDFASARKEHYLESAQPPIVELGELETDLGRRDFSVNAMAISLAPESFGELFDNYSGKSDLENKLLRVLHDKSFEDDPARIIRGVRLSVRLGFSFEKNTRILLDRALEAQYICRLPKHRLKSEFKKAQADPAGDAVIEGLERYGVLEQIQSVLFAKKH